MYIDIFNEDFYFSPFNTSTTILKCSHWDDNWSQLIAAGKLFGNDDTQSMTVIATHSSLLAGDRASVQKDK